jgi:hypothetical protein
MFSLRSAHVGRDVEDVLGAVEAAAQRRAIVEIAGDEGDTQRGELAGEGGASAEGAHGRAALEQRSGDGVAEEARGSGDEDGAAAPGIAHASSHRRPVAALQGGRLRVLVTEKRAPAWVLS